MRLIAPPFPAASRPSKITTTLVPYEPPIPKFGQHAPEPEGLLKVRTPVKVIRAGMFTGALHEVRKAFVADLKFQLRLETV